MLRTLADACCAQGLTLLEQGSPGTAYALLAMAARLAPADPAILFQAGRAASALGKRDKVARYCERALQLDPLFVQAHELALSNFMHGEGYLRLLRRIQGLVKPRTYVEIGVSEGDSIRCVAPETLGLGIDPAPAVAFGLPSNIRIFRETSDEFFARHDVRAELSGLPVDLAFIDGMHHFEFALRDFINLERACHPDSTILIHDCFPHDRTTAGRERVLQFWTGDVWRLIVLLKKYRPELLIRTVAAPPTGLAVVRHLDPSSRVLEQRLSQLIEEFSALEYDYLEKNRAAKLNLVPNDWSTVGALFAPPGRG